MNAHRMSLSAALSCLLVGTALASEELAGQSGCLKCHDVFTDKVGPAWIAVAERYSGDPPARDELIKAIKYGGKGHWTAVTGGMPMPPHYATLDDEEIARLVDWILGLGG